MRKNKKYGVIPRKYDIPLSVIYKKDELKQNIFKRDIENTLLQKNYSVNLGTDNELQLPTSYILMGQDTNKDGVINDNDIKVNNYGGLDIRVEDQDGTSLCWAFASIKSLETNLLLNGYGEYDFSELHLDYLQSNLFIDTFRDINSGGNFTNFENYINEEEGPVLETEVPFYSEYSSISEYEYLQGISQRVEVNEEDFINMPSINKATTSYTDEELTYFRKIVKEHIMKNGSLEASVRSQSIVDSVDSKNKVLNYQGDHIADHAISIIGWDDNFSKENFPTSCRPNNDGAYIALNSYGEEWGNSGIFYISYEDILVEKSMNGVSNAYILDVLDIYVDTEPYSINYTVGETFNRDGMVIKAKYQNGEEKEITEYTISPEVITENTEYVTISYTEGNSTKTTTNNVNLFNSKSSLENGINLYYDNINKVLIAKGTGNLTINLDNYDIEKLVLDEGIKEISSNCINNLNNLNRIYILDRECTVSNNFNTNNNTIVYCYKNSTIEEYCETNNINYFAYDNYYNCGKENYAFLNKTDNKLIISGSGEIYEYKLNEIPWKQEDTYINSIEIDNGITCISNKLFAENTNIQTIKLGNDVTEIGEYAFYNCTNLRQIELNDNLKSIGKCVFYNCTSLTEISIPDNVEKIGEYCFYNCTRLEDVDLPEKIDMIEDYMFYNCMSLKEIDLPDSIRALYSKAFMNCTSLEKIKMPKNLGPMSNWTFANCTSLKEVDFSNSNPIQIGDATFNGCSSLEEFIMPDSITSISQGVFGDCTSLKKLEFSHGLTRLWSGVAQLCTAIEEISVPYGIKIIGDGNFLGGRNLKKVILPCSLVTIGNYNFGSCNNLQYLIIPDSVIINDQIDLIGYSSAKPTIYCKSNSSIQEYAVNKGMNYIIDDTKPNLEVSQEELENGLKRITITASDDNKIVGLSDYPYSFDGGETWQPESQIDIDENRPITVCVRDAVGNIATEDINVEVKELTGIEITNVPGKVEYIEGQSFETEGMIVTARYNNGTTEEITDYTINPEGALTAEDTKVAISYTVNGVTKTAEVNITVIVKGDVNGDNQINFRDILLINKHRLRKTSLTGIYLEAAEVTGDGEVNFRDILQINKFRLGKINSL